MPFKVRVSPAVAKTKHGVGTRFRGGITFSRTWSYFDTVSKEIKTGEHLEVKRASRAEMDAAGAGVDQMSLMGEMNAQQKAEAEDGAEAQCSGRAPSRPSQSRSTRRSTATKKKAKVDAKAHESGDALKSERIQ